MSIIEEYAGYNADCYVLSSNRTKEFVASFLDKFLPNRSEMADKYEVPQYEADTTFEFNSTFELIEYLQQHANIPYTIYWSNLDISELKGGMCFFTNDGYLILGLYCETKYPNTEIEDHHLADLKDFCRSEYALIEYEQPAPVNRDEFLEKIRKLRTT